MIFERHVNLNYEDCSNRNYKEGKVILMDNKVTTYKEVNNKKVLPAGSTFC